MKRDYEIWFVVSFLMFILGSFLYLDEAKIVEDSGNEYEYVRVAKITGGLTTDSRFELSHRIEKEGWTLVKVDGNDFWYIKDSSLDPLDKEIVGVQISR